MLCKSVVVVGVRTLWCVVGGVGGVGFVWMDD
jgi:hypothetical protein